MNYLLPTLLFADNAILAYLSGLAGILTPLTAAYLLSISLIIFLLWIATKRWSRLNNKIEKALVYGIIISILVNLPNLLLPDISFDAVWYHLPLAKTYAVNTAITYPESIPYNALPRLGDMILSLGFVLTNTQYTSRLLVTLAALILIANTYRLSREIGTTPEYTLGSVLIIVTTGVVGWQMTAAYTDIFQSLFQLAALIAFISFLKTNNQIESLCAAFFTGVAVGTKIQAFMHIISLIIAIIFLAIITKTYKRYLSSIFLTIITVLLFLAPFMIENWNINQSAIYPLNTKSKQTDQLQHAGATSVSDWIQTQTKNILRIPILLSFNHASHTTPAPLILLPIVLIGVYKKRFVFLNISESDKSSLIIIFLSVYVVTYSLLWHFTPPPESRYALTCLIVIIVLSTKALESLPSSYAILKRTSIFLVLVSIIINLSIRAGVLARNLPFIIGHKSQEEYLKLYTHQINQQILRDFYTLQD